MIRTQKGVKSLSFVHVGLWFGGSMLIFLCRKFQVREQLRALVFISFFRLDISGFLWACMRAVRTADILTKMVMWLYFLSVSKKYN